MKITVSKREKITYVHKVVDKEATEAAKAAAPPDERDEVEDVMKDADFTLDLWPLSLREEEEVMDAVSRADRNAEGAVATPTKLINTLFARKVCGWDGIYTDDAREVPFEFDPKWDKPGKRVPDEVVQGFELGVRAGAFAYLIEQAGMGDEEAVGK